MNKIKGLYVHIPFCVRKCAYCDFYSLAGKNELIARYVDAVITESRAYAGSSFQTLYFGGGTPSLLGANNLKKLIWGLRQSFDLTQLTEATIEVNPDSATGALLQSAREAGINRLSVGVQSLSDNELASVGRVHKASQAIETIERAKNLGFENISTDLIAGLPGQNWDSLYASLDILVRSGIKHLSLYCLSLEEGTPLAENPPVDLPSDDLQAELFEQACSYLENKGFVHYEISNFALPEHECLQNLNYWRGGEYLGLGPAAASHLGGKRFNNRHDLAAYLQHPRGVVENIEQLGIAEKASEEAMLRLRLLSEGLSISALETKFGTEVVKKLTVKLDDMVEAGSLTFNGAVYRLPLKRVLTSNPIFANVLSD